MRRFRERVSDCPSACFWMCERTVEEDVHAELVGERLQNDAHVLVFLIRVLVGGVPRVVHVHYNEGGDGSVHGAEVVVKEGPLGGAGGVVLVGGDEDGVDWADLVAVVEEASGKLVGGSEPIPLRKTGNGTDAQNIDLLELALHPLLLK